MTDRPLRLSVLMLVLACRFGRGCGTQGIGDRARRRALSRRRQPGSGGRRPRRRDPTAAAKPRLPAKPGRRARHAAERVGGSRHMERPVPAAGNVGRHHDVGPAVGLYVAGRDAAAQSAGGKIVPTSTQRPDQAPLPCSIASDETNAPDISPAPHDLQREAIALQRHHAFEMVDEHPANAARIGRRGHGRNRKPDQVVARHEGSDRRGRELGESGWA